MVKVKLQAKGKYRPIEGGERKKRKFIEQTRPMPEHVKINPRFKQKFKERLLNVRMDASTARENHAKLLSARNEMLNNERQQNAKWEWGRIKSEMEPLYQEKVAQRREELANKYHDWDSHSYDRQIGEPMSKMHRKARETRDMMMMMAKGKGKGR